MADNNFIFQELNLVDAWIPSKGMYTFNRDYNEIYRDRETNFTTSYVRNYDIFKRFNDKQAEGESLFQFTENQKYVYDIFRRNYMTGKTILNNGDKDMNTYVSGNPIVSPLKFSTGSWDSLDMPTFRNKKYAWIPGIYTNVGYGGAMMPSSFFVGKTIIKDYIMCLEEYKFINNFTLQQISDPARKVTVYGEGEIPLSEAVDRYGELYIYEHKYTFDNSNNNGSKRPALYYLNRHATAPYKPMVQLRTNIESMIDKTMAITTSTYLPVFSFINIDSFLNMLLSPGKPTQTLDYSSVETNSKITSEQKVPVSSPILSTCDYFTALIYDNSKFIWRQVGTKEQFIRFFNDMGIKATFNQQEAQFTITNSWTTPINIGETIPNAPLPDWSSPESPGTGGGVPGGGIVGPGGTGSGIKGGGGTGGGRGTGDTIGNVSDPYVEGSVRTGTGSINESYALNYSEIKEMSKAFVDGSLWTNISTFFKDVDSGIINLIKFPFDLKEIDPSSLQFVDKISLIGVELDWVGGKVSGYKIGRTMRTRIEMGTFTFKEFFGSFLDYDPYTVISLYLPYIGYRSLSVTSVMDKTIRLVYNVSYIDGSMLAILYSDGVPIQIYEGSIGQQIPMNRNDFADVIQSGIKTVAVAAAAGGVAGAIGKAIAGATTIQTTAAAATDAASAGAVMKYASTNKNSLDSTMELLSSLGLPPFPKFQGQKGAQATTTLSGVANLNPAVAVSAINTIGNIFGKRGSSSAYGTAQGMNARALSPIPYVIIERPIPNVPEEYKYITGYQTYIYRQLSECTGMTICENVKLTNFDIATESEKNDIKSLLQNGVIF